MKKEASITVFAGGTGSEREVSLSTGMALTESLAKSFKTHMIDLTEEALPAGLDPAETIVFPAIHGTFGEDGALQSLLEKAGAHRIASELQLPGRAILQVQLADLHLDSSRVVDQRIDNSLFPVSVPHWSIEVIWQVQLLMQYGLSTRSQKLDLVMRSAVDQQDYQPLNLGWLFERSTQRALGRLPQVLADEGRLSELLFSLRSDPPTSPLEWKLQHALEDSFALLLSIDDETRHAALAMFLSSAQLELQQARDLARWYIINDPAFAIQRDALSWYLQQEAASDSAQGLRPQATQLLRWLLLRASSHKVRTEVLLGLKNRSGPEIREILLYGATDADPRVAEVALSQLDNFKAATAAELKDLEPSTTPSLPPWTHALDGRYLLDKKRNQELLLSLAKLAKGQAAKLWLKRWINEQQVAPEQQQATLTQWQSLSRSDDPELREAVLRRLLRERHQLGIDELITERAEMETEASIRALALGQLSDGPRQLKVLLSAASSPNNSLRQTAAIALARQLHSSAELRLQELRKNDPEPAVRRAARKALRLRKKELRKRP